MKFKALVVAAMVITSVNAVWHEKGAGYSGDHDDELGSVSPPGLLGNDPNPPQESGATEYDPKCDPILSELDSLQEKVEEVYLKLLRQIPDSYKQETGLNGLSHPELQGWLKQCYKDNPELQPIKQELIELEEKNRVAWIELVTEGCSIESRPYLMSPEDMIKRGYFSKWYD
ncbi:hypothetical protein BASA60_001856 [Batrachochytrium salamandrivorans]|nr:hypothetical protein BASA62_004521 [Batrachochytrium salamandrivorans]KAH6582611.1 hypothetical protein BASA60_001856 [Batrachochytrium salamandrivorans]KAH9252365.1 hypothetical protein BASA81_009736 [Batrachochytrium salamandrivorans]